MVFVKKFFQVVVLSAVAVGSMYAASPVQCPSAESLQGDFGARYASPQNKAVNGDLVSIGDKKFAVGIVPAFSIRNGKITYYGKYRTSQEDFSKEKVMFLNNLYGQCTYRIFLPGVVNKFNKPESTQLILTPQ